MGKKKQLFLNIIFVIIVFAFTVYKLSNETDLRSGVNQALELNYFYLILALFCTIAYVLLESVILYFLLKKIGKEVSFFNCSLYSFIGFFYSCITPSASGGQPAQMLYMKKKDGIAVGESTPLLMIVTIAYKGVLVIIGSFIVIFNTSNIKDYITGAGIYIYIGLIANVVLLIFMVLLLIKPEILYKLCKIFYNSIFSKFLGKYKYKIRNKAVAYLDKYIETAIYYRGHYNNMAMPVIVITFVQRMMYFAITVFVYKSFGLSGVSLLTVLTLSASINIAVDMLPLPGGMGATELLFISLFSVIFGEAKVVSAMLINRFFSFYLLIILGVVAIIIMNIRIKRKKIEGVDKNDRIL